MEELKRSCVLLQENPKLLMRYYQALTRSGEE